MKSDANGSRILPLLILLLAGSGCAALIYEIVWFQLLQLVIGSSAVSLGLLLAAYMGGLCLGSALLPRMVSRGLHPLRVYGVIEFGIGILGLLVLFAVPLVGRMYVAAGAQGLIGLVVRGVIAAVCLLPPTVLLGASLPAIARWVKTTPKGLSWVGLLYSANIAGAVFGCLLAGFYLLRVYDMAVATYAAVAVNLVVAGISFAAAARSPQTAAPGIDQENKLLDSRRPTRRWLVLVAISLSGLCALGAEVIWTRLLSLLLGGTVYTFSIILAVFLLGLWAGSSAGSLLARQVQHAWLALAVCQILLSVAIAWTGYTLSHSLPYWPIDPWLSLNPWFNFEIDLVRCAWAILPATLLWGASFPLALAAAAAPGQDPGRLSGEIYAANTAGSVVGALIFSLILIPNVGTRISQQLLIGLAAVAAVAATLSVSNVPRLRAARYATIASAIVLGVALTPLISEVPWAVVAYGRRLAPIVRAFDFDREHPTTVLYRGEGINSSFLIAERAGQRQFFVSGKAEASTAPLDMRLERMMGHVPALIHPHPRSILTVGFGAGVTAGSFVTYPDVESIVICELESQIPPASTKYFGTQNYNVLNDPRTRIVYDDARHYIFTTRDKFDLITTDPIHPWVKGTSTLYSKEYYELVKSRLNPGGVVAQWLPIYDSDPETIKTELATFFAVFPSGTVWSNNLNGDGYDLVLIGQAGPSVLDVDDVQRRLDDPGYAAVLQSLSEVGFHAAVELFATYAGRASDLQPLLVHAQINNDMNLRLQYIAGLGLNSMAFQGIYRTILAYRRFPDGLFIGSTGRIDALRTLLRPR
ncbi:MAG TPA: SAM-dependent methyltransferase [Terriglobia bacterium]|nr:SAM-dependent methyltransferase [Terriglobia bacterium]